MWLFFTLVVLWLASLVVLLLVFSGWGGEMFRRFWKWVHK